MATQYDNIISAAASQNGVDPTTAMGIYRVENGPGNPNSVSSSGAVGLLQIEPNTAKMVDPTYNPATGLNANGQSLTDPTYNAQIGTSYMAGLQNGNYLPPRSGPVQTPQDLYAAYYSGGVYKNANGYTTKSGAPGGPPTVNSYVSNATSAAAGGSAYGTASSASGTQSSVSPHSIPDQAGLYGGIDQLNTPINTLNVPSPFLAYVQMTVGGNQVPQAGFVGGSSSTNYAGVTGGSGAPVDLGGISAVPPMVITNVSPDMTIGARKIRITDFSFTEVADRGSGTFVVKLYLETATELNTLATLIANYQQVVLVWGYQQTKGGLVRSFTGSVVRLYHQFMGSGYNVIIEGMDAAFSGLANVGAYSYAPVTGRASDVVSWIASQHGWATVIEETIPLYTGDDPHKGPKVYMRSAGETELSFINNVLCAGAQSAIRSYEGSPYGHYVCYFQQSAKNPLGELHFHSLLVPTSNGAPITPVRTYVWGGLSTDSRSAVVRDFTMDYRGYGYRNWGTGATNSASVDPTSGQVNTTKIVGTRVTDFPLQAVHQLGSQDSVRTIATSAKTQAESQAKTLQLYLEVRDDCFGASLTILGDPFLRVSDVVHVVVQRPGQQPQAFYDWSIIRMYTTIANGDYQLKCDMILNQQSSNVESTYQLTAAGAGMSDYANQPSTNPNIPAQTQ